MPNATSANLFTYPAYVVKVLDGDTLNAVVDLGFGIVLTQTLCLRGLDAPELISKEGMEAKKFLEKMVRSPSTPVLIRTTKSDKYDRYLADVFVDGKYINQKLVEAGHAVVVEG